MHLKRLELAGFKSFAQKTALEFAGPVTAIVGPNGAGKSNLIDAFRWLLGEREVKQMRGGRAEDLIFAGGARAAAMSLAQAALIFDNRDHFFPVDYAEVSIRRRVGRDGVSEYLLNDAAVRLKDVLDFFAKSRLGTRGFSIVNQGESDLFVRALPKDRRAMLEEILGLREYELKKHEAELKLRATAVNLDKARALIAEMLPHLRLLRREISRSEKHGALQAELGELAKTYFAARLWELGQGAAAAAPEREATQRERAERSRELAALEKALGEVEAAQPREATGFSKTEERRAALERKKGELEREAGKIEAQTEFLRERAGSGESAERLAQFLHELRGTIEELSQAEDLDEVKSVLTQLIADIDALLEGGEEEGSGPGAEEALRRAKAKIAGQIETTAAELEEVRKAQRAAAAAAAGFNERFRRAYAAVEAKRGEIAALVSREQSIALAGERVDLRREELEREARDMGYTIGEFNAEAPQKGFDAAVAGRRMLKLRGELAAIGEVDESLLKEAAATEERRRFLESQVKDLEKASKDLAHLIRELDQKIHREFTEALSRINRAFQEYFAAMFGGGRAHLRLTTYDVRPTTDDVRLTGGTPPQSPSSEEGETGGDADAGHAADHGGIEIDVSIPRKKIRGLEMLSGGERCLVSIAALFALISVSPPPFIVLDEVDAALDDANTRRFAELIKEFAKKTQFVIVTHNRATMEAANALYGVTMREDGTSRVLSLKLE